MQRFANVISVAHQVADREPRMTSSPDTRLARMLCSRLCHDLGGAVGSLTGSLDLVEPGEDELLGIAKETGVALRLRLRLFAAAWGGPTADCDAAGMTAMLAGSPASPRVGFSMAWRRGRCCRAPSCRWR
jgi:histidine phosphotransferase ChpT